MPTILKPQPENMYFLMREQGADLLNRNGKVLLSINVSADNVTNVAYQSHLSRLKYFEDYPDNPTGRKGIYNMGRNISFKFIAPLNF